MAHVFAVLAFALLTRFSATGEVQCLCATPDVPEARHQSELTLAPVVRLNARAELILDGSVLTASALAGALREKQKSIHALAPAAVVDEATVNLVADKTVTFRAIRPVLEACAQLGVAVSLITMN